jgi:hypothetical protein
MGEMGEGARTLWRCFIDLQAQCALSRLRNHEMNLSSLRLTEKFEGLETQDRAGRPADADDDTA